MKKYITILSIVIIFCECKKEPVNINCDKLSKAIIANNANTVKDVVNFYINQMASKTYSPQNLNTLAQNISSQCSVTIGTVCFDCIDTLPSMSEIRVSTNSNGSIIIRVVDISYTPSNEMIAVAVHD
jgi:hypothetical protein